MFPVLSVGQHCLFAMYHLSSPVLLFFFPALLLRSLWQMDLNLLP